jgi:DNA-binding CsgD family transcriptional regulator
MPRLAIRDEHGLSVRQREVLTAYCRADTAEEAAQSLGITPATLRNTMTSVRSILGVTSTRQAAYRVWAPR